MPAAAHSGLLQDNPVLLTVIMANLLIVTDTVPMMPATACTCLLMQGKLMTQCLLITCHQSIACHLAVGLAYHSPASTRLVTTCNFTVFQALYVPRTTIGLLLSLGVLLIFLGLLF